MKVLPEDSVLAVLDLDAVDFFMVGVGLGIVGLVKRKVTRCRTLARRGPADARRTLSFILICG